MAEESSVIVFYDHNKGHNTASLTGFSMMRLTLSIFLLFFAAILVPAFAENNDSALASLIATRTSRASLGVESKLPNGEGVLDLAGKAQHVTIAKQGADGNLAAMCVGSVVEAEAFLGRSLPKTTVTSTSELAARHGMSADEFAQITAMIAAAPAQVPAAPLTASITILNGDGPGEGFNSTAARASEGGNSATTLGGQRLNVFNRAAQIWGQFLDSTVATQIAANFDDLSPCSSSGGVLGGAGTAALYQNFGNAPFTGTYYPAALANKIRRADGNPGAEINAQFNSLVDNACLGPGTRFYYGLDNTTPANTINLLVVVLHEIGHGLGSASYADELTGSFQNNVPDIWARFMFDSAQNRTWLQMTAAQRATSAVNNTLFWDSPSMRVAAPGYLTIGADAMSRVRLYAPTSLQQGSSVSHFDTSAAPNLLMEPAINAGIPLTLDLTRQQLRDIGWYRDSNLDGVADVIANVQPSGNTVALGTTTTISWTNQGGFNKNVTVELSLDAGVTYSPITTPAQPALGIVNTGATGSFAWNVPNNIATTQARVRVREFDFADLAGSSAANFTIAVANTPPTIALSAAPTRQQGSPASSSVLATISDAQSAAASLTVATFNVASGLTLGTPINTNGSVSLAITASCSAAASSSFGLRVTDAGGLISESTITVAVSANSAPTLSYPSANLAFGAGLSVNPSTGPSDNGTATLSIISFGTYTGGASVAASAVVSLNTAQPAGNHTITVRALDNCNLANDVALLVNVGPLNTAPSFAPGPLITRTQGEQNSALVSLGVASDAQTAAGSLVVTQIGGGSAGGVNLTNLLNTAGNVSAAIAAECLASSGTLRLQISDGQLTSIANVNINIINNVAPTFGSYPPQILMLGASKNVVPSAPPSDSSPIQSVNVQIDPSGYTGSLSVTPASGVVSLSNVGPASNFTVTLFVRDTCNAVGTTNFTLSIDPDRFLADGFE